MVLKRFCLFFVLYSMFGLARSGQPGLTQMTSFLPGFGASVSASRAIACNARPTLSAAP